MAVKEASNGFASLSGHHFIIPASSFNPVMETLPESERCILGLFF